MSNRRYKILVVEDDQNLRITLTELLRIEGFAVVTARDGDEGYLQAMAHQPDPVITDLTMPPLAGLEIPRLSPPQPPTLHATTPIALTANLTPPHITDTPTAAL